MADGASGPGTAASPDGAPGGWRIYSGGHFMRIDGGEHGKLARLADVRDWLMALREWPMDVAADEVIARLRQAQATGLELFVAHSKSYALPLRPDAHMLSPEEVAQRGGLRHLDQRLLGFEGVCNAILNGWVGEYRGYLSAPRVDAVCVRAAVAHELWGWGSVAGAGAGAGQSGGLTVVPFQKTGTEPAAKPEPQFEDGKRLPWKSQFPEWTGERLAKARAQINGRDATKQLEKKTGLPAREITDREREWRAEQKLCTDKQVKAGK